MNDHLKTQLALIQYAKHSGQKHLRKNLIEDLCPGIQIDVNRIPEIVFEDENGPWHKDIEPPWIRIEETKKLLKQLSKPSHDGDSIESNCAPDMRTPSGRIRPRGKQTNRHFPIR